MKDIVDRYLKAKAAYQGQKLGDRTKIVELPDDKFEITLPARSGNHKPFTCDESFIELMIQDLEL